MHAGAVLEDPGHRRDRGLYAGPGYVGATYNGTGQVITKKLLREDPLPMRTWR